MQMLDVYTTIANGGVTRPPRLLDATIDSTRQASPDAPARRPAAWSRAETAATMTDMLTGVVQRRHRRVRGDPRLHRRGQDRNVAQGRSTAGTRTARWRRSSGSRPRSTRGSRRSSCSTNPDAIRWRAPRHRCSRDHAVRPDPVATSPPTIAVRHAVRRPLGAPRRRPGQQLHRSPPARPSSAPRPAGRRRGRGRQAAAVARAVVDRAAAETPGSLGHDTSQSG